MNKLNLRTVLGSFAWMAVLLLGSCNAHQQASSTVDEANLERAAEADETQRMAQAALGSQANVLAHGDLAKNGLEQIFTVNRMGAAANLSGDKPEQVGTKGILITRAVIIEKKDGKWSEIFRCDERLKNPNGYLGGSPAGRAAGWRLEYDSEAKQGLEMRFTPADFGANQHGTGDADQAERALVVRWNTKVKRYQSLDQSQERYLNEVPTLETPESFLK